MRDHLLACHQRIGKPSRDRETQSYNKNRFRKKNRILPNFHQIPFYFYSLWQVTEEEVQPTVTPSKLQRLALPQRWKRKWECSDEVTYSAVPSEAGEEKDFRVESPYPNARYLSSGDECVVLWDKSKAVLRVEKSSIQIRKCSCSAMCLQNLD
jgi:hypothetical protein